LEKDLKNFRGRVQGIVDKVDMKNTLNNMVEEIV
jgi:hypothetical protein